MRNHKRNLVYHGMLITIYMNISELEYATYARVNLIRHELVDSEPQWREAQKRKGEGVQRAVVSSNEMLNIISFIRYLAVFPSSSSFT